MTEVQQSILQTLVALIGVLVALVRVIGPLADKYAEAWAHKEWAKIDAKLPENVRAVIHAAAVFGAQSAEQMRLAQRISDAADSKKQYAVQAAERWLKAQGYTIDLTTLGDAIESVILQGLHLPPPDHQPAPATSAAK